MAPVHGRRVVGDENYDKAVREEVGGVHTFGVRVRGAIPDNGPTNAAKRTTEHGPLVVANAQFQDAKGNVADGVTIDDLRSILAENPTFFDSLFEAELARPDGARPEALGIFYEIERGIKGQGRADVMEDIRQLMGARRPIAAAQADAIQARLEQADRQQRRVQENSLLVDADRLQALAEREESIQRIKEAGTEQLTTLSPNVERQVADIAEEQGLTITPNTGSASGTVPTKPDGTVSPQTQQPDSGDAGSGATGTDVVGGEEDVTETTGQNFDEMTMGELTDYLGEDAVSEIEGSGASGRIVKADLVKAAKKAARSRK